MAAIFNSDILVFPHKLTHTCQDWFQPFPKKKTSLTLPSPLFAQKNFTHSFWLNLMMAAILTSAILNCAILDSAILVFPLKVTHTCQDWFPPFAPKKLNSYFPLHQLHKKTSLIHSDSMWWWQPSWILSPWIQPFCTKKLYSFILTELGDGSHLKFCHVGFRHCHLGFRHLVNFSQIHSKTLSLHSDSDSN